MKLLLIVLAKSRLLAFKTRINRLNRKMASYKYPVAAKDETVVDIYHGKKVIDEYRWLENPDSQETKDFVDKQNGITTPYINSCSFKEQISSKLKTLWNYPKLSPPMIRGTKYYQFRNTGLQNQSVLYVQDSLQSEGKVFLDPNLFSEDGTVALVYSSFTEDGQTLAYGLSASGSDWIEIHFKNTTTGQDYPDTLKKVRYSFLTWMHDNKGCFYGAYLDQMGKTDGSETDSNKNQKLYYHVLGNKQSEDIVVAEFEDPDIRCHALVSHCGNYLVLTPIKGCKNNLLYFCNLKNIGEIKGKLPLTAVVMEFVYDFDYITNEGSKFIFRTNKNAPNYQLVEIDFDNYAQENWKLLISEHPNDVLDWVHPIDNNKLVLCYIHDVKDTLSLYNVAGEKLKDFPLPLGSINGITGKKKQNEMFFGFSSFLTPNVTYRVDFKEPEIKATVFHETKLAGFDPSKFESTQVFYKSKDGTTIPMFLTNKKGLPLDGTNPCLLYGYGGFNASIGPGFAVSRLIFTDNFNGIFAIANIRGGGEYGENWHNAGRFGNKQNVFDDFQYAARYLIDQKYTSPGKLTIQGASNGGLLVAACVNQAPELFGCALCLVGVLDMLRYHKFTIGYTWKSDYGCADEPEQFKYLYEYSPLHNIKVPKGDVQYPAVLLLTADHDDRVVPLHSLKYIAKLQEVVGRSPQQKQPLLIRVDTKSGHGAGKPTSKVIEEQTEVFCFVQKSLNIKYTE